MSLHALHVQASGFQMFHALFKILDKKDCCISSPPSS